MTNMFVDPVIQPNFSPVYIPELASLSLSDDERATISKLQMRAYRHRYWMELTDSYYRGMQVITNLNIAIPPELSQLRTIVGWPRKAVDPIVQRSALDGFRLRGATDTDQDLRDVWDANGMDAEQSLAFTDSLVMGRGWVALGSPQVKGDAPVMSVESPLNMSVSWDVRTALPKEALQSYWLDDRRHAVLYVLGQTIYIGEDDNGIWQITDRDKHGFPYLPIIRLANQPRSNERDGASEITPELMSVTDSACRTLLRWEVAGEFFSVPQKLLLGATESDFQNADGTPKSAWSTYISNVLALERDEDGNVPEVKQFTAMDPSVFSKQIDSLAAQAASIVRGNPQDFGLYTQGNPVSADAYNSTEADRNSWIRSKHRMWGVDMIKSMQMAIRFMHNGDLPVEFERMACDWLPPEQINLAAMSDAMSKQTSSGSVPATSDPVLKRLGWTAVERAQLEQDRKLDQGAAILAELASSLQAKQARTDLAVAHDINPAPVTPSVGTQPNGS